MSNIGRRIERLETKFAARDALAQAEVSEEGIAALQAAGPRRNPSRHPAHPTPFGS
jgi:hypothetical protein